MTKCLFLSYRERTKYQYTYRKLASVVTKLKNRIFCVIAIRMLQKHKMLFFYLDNFIMMLDSDYDAVFPTLNKTLDFGRQK